ALPPHGGRDARGGAAPLLRGDDTGPRAPGLLCRPDPTALGRRGLPAALAVPPGGRARSPTRPRKPHHPDATGGRPVMSRTPAQTVTERLPRLSPSRLEAWDRCPAAYRFAYVLGLPQPIGDQAPRLLGSVAHAILEGYLQEALRSGERPPLGRVAAI